jgi:CheY-like chemotaxis protein
VVEQLCGPLLIPRKDGSGLRHCFERSPELARSQPPDLILCDVRMPGMSGLEAATAFTKSSGAVMRCWWP